VSECVSVAANTKVSNYTNLYSICWHWSDILWFPDV